MFSKRKFKEELIKLYMLGKITAANKIVDLISKNIDNNITCSNMKLNNELKDKLKAYTEIDKELGITMVEKE